MIDDLIDLLQQFSVILSVGIDIQDEYDCGWHDHSLTIDDLSSGCTTTLIHALTTRLR
jgi:hypothetical protein